MVTALIVARPMVAGPAAGVVPGSTDTGNLVLTLLWFLTAIGWAGYYAAVRPSLRRPGVVEGALAAFGALAVVSVTQAAHARPAWVLVADAGAILLAFWLVRQLAWSPAENFAVVNVLAATGVALAAEALVRLAWPLQSSIEPTVAHIFAMERLAPNDQAAHLATLAGYLALLLPILAAATFVIGRRGRLVSLVLPGGLLVLGVAAMIALRMNVLAISLVGAAALGCVYQSASSPARWKPWAVAAVVVGAAFIALRFLTLPDTSQEATRALLGDHAALGVGPGNFLRAVVKYEGPPPAPLVTGPATALEAVRAASGIFALISLAVAAIAVLAVCWVGFRRADDGTPQEKSGTPWESYAGAVVGLALGFLLRPAEANASLTLTITLAIGRSFVWFASFALLDALPRSRRWTVGALGVGVMALVCFASVQEGTIALALLLAVAAAAALNLAQGTERTWGSGPLVVRLAPALGLLVLTVLFALKVFQPIAEVASEVREARRSYGAWSDTIAPRVADRSVDAPTRLATARNAKDFLVKQIIRPLTRAVEADRDNPAAWAERAYWDAETARVLGEIRELVEPVDRDPIKRDQLAYATRAVNVDCQRVQALDPTGPTGYFLTYELRLQFAQEPTATIDERRTQCELALQSLRRLAEVTPPGPEVSYWIADMQFRLAQAIRLQMADLPPPGDSDQEKNTAAVLRKEFVDRAVQATNDCEAAATEAKRLDDLARGTPRALSGEQRDHLAMWLRH